VARDRELLKDWEARGWRIDEEAVAREEQRVARTIPSPGRREQPKGWVLDPVPLVPPAASYQREQQCLDSTR
jgi:hypothetical protein